MRPPFSVRLPNIQLQTEGLTDLEEGDNVAVDPVLDPRHLLLSNPSLLQLLSESIQEIHGSCGSGETVQRVFFLVVVSLKFGIG